MKSMTRQVLTLAAGSLLLSLLVSVSSSNPILAFIDAWSILGLLLIVVGLILFLSRGGYFDFLVYSMSQTPALFSKKDPIQNRKLDYADYLQQKKDQRKGKKNLILTAGLLVTGINIILTLLYELCF